MWASRPSCSTGSLPFAAAQAASSQDLQLQASGQRATITSEIASAASRTASGHPRSSSPAGIPAAQSCARARPTSLQLIFAPATCVTHSFLPVCAVRLP
ncbi:MAG: hypothetical protein M0Q13_08160 [Methanothrix sp.]|nr:hypothetical protein [Methanothrix sp.]